MNDNDAQKLIATLEEMRDTQQLQVERQLEALTLQREQAAIVQRQIERARKIGVRS